MQPGHRRLALTALVLSLVGTVLVPSPAQAAASVTMSSYTVASGPDFASDRYADAWDFTNSADLPMSAGRAGVGVSNVSLQNGSYVADVAPGGWLNLVQTISGSLPWGRDGQAMPMDTSTYTRFSMRIWSARADYAMVVWNNCPEMALSCYGAQRVITHAGWGVYDVAMKKLPTETAAEWTGQMVGLRLDPAESKGGRVQLDWVRLYQPGSGRQITLSGSSGADIMLDPDRDPTNGNESTLARDNATVRTGSDGRATIDTSLLSPGTWQIGMRTSGGFGYAARPLVVSEPPMPVVLDPDASGGLDVNDVLGGSRWDMNEASDISSQPNAAGSVANGIFHGRNAGPVVNDPNVRFTLPGLVDGTRFHRLTVKAAYDGPFSLADAPGGGMVARWIWGAQGSSGLTSSEDLVVAPGDNTITVDLSDDRFRVVDAYSSTQTGWAGQRINFVSFDPNEDPSTDRTWRIDDVKLAEDDKGSGSFAVRFTDANHAAGTVAEVIVRQGSPTGPATTVGRDIAVTPGVNTFNWSMGSMPSGTYWVGVTMKRGGATATAMSTGPVQMKATAPFGSVDSATAAGAGGVRVRGWAIDPHTGDAASPVHVYVDGRAVVTSTGTSRPDVGAAFGVGADHGFDATVTGLPDGSHQACAFAYRAAGSTLLGCRTVVTGLGANGSDPIGSVDVIAAATGGVRVSGWTLDRSTATSNTFHVYVDGAFAARGTADGDRPDVAAALPGYGSRHGFGTTVPVSPGRHQVCVFGLDQVAPGANILLRCADVVTPALPWGSVDAVGRSGGTVTVAGWVLDPRAGSAAAHVYIDGVGAAAVPTTLGRADVAGAFPSYTAPTTGFSTRIAVPAGAHQVCVFAVGAQGSQLLNCRGV